jgi:DeoR/GlpR family transcriptional regulator of sugar metabolism
MDTQNYWSEHHNNCGAIVRDCKALSVSEVAELYSISESTIRRHIDLNKFPMFKVMNRVRGFKCWVTVAIRNPKNIYYPKEENPAVKQDSSKLTSQVGSYG